MLTKAELAMAMFKFNKEADIPQIIHFKDETPVLDKYEDLIDDTEIV